MFRSPKHPSQSVLHKIILINLHLWTEASAHRLALPGELKTLICKWLFASLSLFNPNECRDRKSDFQADVTHLFPRFTSNEQMRSGSQRNLTQLWLLNTIKAETATPELNQRALITERHKLQEQREENCCCLLLLVHAATTRDTRWKHLVNSCCSKTGHT